jgi:hemerythrin
MAIIEWRKEFETGDAAVDYEHQELVSLLNEVIETIKDGKPTNESLDSLGEVNARISGHFALEEVEMRRFKYDQYDEHKEDHERLLDDIRDLMDDFEDGSFKGDVDAFSDRLRDWFVDHFKTQDARLHSVLSSD